MMVQKFYFLSFAIPNAIRELRYVSFGRAIPSAFSSCTLIKKKLNGQPKTVTIIIGFSLNYKKSMSLVFTSNPIFMLIQKKKPSAS